MKAKLASGRQRPLGTAAAPSARASRPAARIGPARGLARAAGAVLLAACSVAAADWATCRGNLARTGCIDGQAGPKTPAVLWAQKAQENFVASPVPTAEALYVCGIGAFNTGALHALAADDGPPQRTLWTKMTPFLKRPTVCSPAIAEGLTVFGDGMHQTDGAVLYCLRAQTGTPVWQLAVPGRLVHLEGAPTVQNGHVYIGAGEAGILCVALKQVSLEGKEQDLAAVAALVEQRWAAFQAKYEQDKAKDPTFAIPPSEDALPKPVPKLLWQQGAGKWHVDAPVAVSGERVVVASARVEQDKVGTCALVCLQAGDGATLWETPLRINPWAGPTVAGELVLVACSSIRFDTKQLKQAAGEVVAADLASGQIRWRRDVPGGVLSSIAVSDGLAVFAATDGKLRAWAVASGEPKWTYDAGAPFFAAPAVAGGVVYAADLKAVLHAVSLADGKKLWSLDVGADPAVQAPGMVFGSPVVQAGRIYLATCNLEGKAAGQPCAVVCIAEKSAAAQAPPAAAVTVDKDARTVYVPCKIAPRKLPTLNEVYPLEVIATLPAPRGQKAHETVVTFEAVPSEVHKALEGLGLKCGAPAKGEQSDPTGAEVEIGLELTGPDGRQRVVPLEQVMTDSRTGRPMPPLKWHFTGSVLRQADPEKQDKVYAADLSGTLATIFPVTDETVIQAALTMRDSTLLKLETNKELLPSEGTDARLVIRPAASAAPAHASAGADLSIPPLPALVSGPAAPGPAVLAPELEVSWLAPAELPRGPRRLADKDLTTTRPWQQPGQPTALLRAPELPSSPQQATAYPLVSAAAPDAEIGSFLPIRTSPPADGPDPDGDLAAQPAQAVVLSPISSFRQGPAPFLRLAIPDPFAALVDVRLDKLLPDADPPASAAELPPQPKLPAEP